MSRTLSPFAKFAWGVLAYNLFVVLFGAYVRATGSGAGCGAHWPLCNGVVIPRPQRIETVIEFTHRITSGLTLILAVVLVIWAWRQFKKGSLLRWSSAGVILFTITEALVGAMIVLYGWVAKDTSIARAISVPVHLTNTFLLIAMCTITAWWSTSGVPDRLRWNGWIGPALLLGALGMLLLVASGGVTALGDTLFPSSSLAEGVSQDFSSSAHLLTRLRIYHPGIAVSVGVYLFLATAWVRRKIQKPGLENITLVLFVLYALQVILGIINIALLAPVWIQIVHLLVSNLVWISYVLMTITVFSGAVPIHGAARVSDHHLHDGVNQPEKVG